MKYCLISPNRIKIAKKHIKKNLKLVDNVLETENYYLETNKKNRLKMSGFLGEDSLQIIKEDKKRLKIMNESIVTLSKSMQKIKINKKEYYITSLENKKNFNTLFRSVINFKKSFEKVFKISSEMN